MMLKPIYPTEANADVAHPAEDGADVEDDDASEEDAIE